MSVKDWGLLWCLWKSKVVLLFFHGEYSYKKTLKSEHSASTQQINNLRTGAQQINNLKDRGGAYSYTCTHFQNYAPHLCWVRGLLWGAHWNFRGVVVGICCGFSETPVGMLVGVDNEWMSYLLVRVSRGGNFNLRGEILRTLVCNMILISFSR